MRRAPLLLACLLLGACAPKVFVRETPIPGKGFVYVYRPGAFVGWALSPAGFMSGTTPPMSRTFPIRPDKYVVTAVDPGTVTLNTSGPDNKPVTVAVSVLAENALAFIRCDMRMGWLIGGLQCQAVPEEVGMHDVARIKRNERGD